MATREWPFERGDVTARAYMLIRYDEDIVN